MNRIITEEESVNIQDNKKKMLIVMKCYYPDCNSATALIDNIVPSFSDFYDITVICVKSDFKSSDKEFRNGIRIIRKHTVWDCPEIVRKKLIDIIYNGKFDSRLLRFVLSRVVQLLFFPFKLFEKMFGVYCEESYSKRFGIFIENEICKNDVVLTTVMPSENAETLYPVLLKYPDIKWIILHCDPYVDYSKKAKDILDKEEKQNKWYERATLIVLQETILDNVYRGSYKYKDKILPLFIPSMPSIITDEKLSKHKEKIILNQLNGTNMFAKKRISCIFTGLFYSGVREPFFLMDVFSQLHEQYPEIEIYILGTTYDHKIPGFNKKNEDWFFFCGRQPQEICDIAQEEADFLINVGNLVPNLVPSKVMQYISKRKPIINLFHIKNDAVEEYLDDYPLQFSIYYDDYIKSEENKSDIVKKMKRYIDINYGKIAEYDLIKSRYIKYSADNYVNAIMNHKTMNK